jgi:hypothetical protein
MGLRILKDLRIKTIKFKVKFMVKLYKALAYFWNGIYIGLRLLVN